MTNLKIKMRGDEAFCLIIFIFSLLTFNLRPVQAAMTSTDYQIDMPNFNFVSGNATSANYKMGFTGGETGVGPYSSTGYRVKAGFWYIKSIIPFAFSLTPTSIDFGVLAAGSPKTDTVTLTVSAGGAGGYQVTAQETRPITSSSGTTIPDTTCDNGNCSESSAQTWSQTTTYGFGYTTFGNDVPTPFPTAGPAGNQFKQFSNMLLGENPEPVMVSSAVGKNRSSTVTLKINISGTQAAGIYQNQLVFVATPTY